MSLKILNVVFDQVMQEQVVLHICTNRDAGREVGDEAALYKWRVELELLQGASTQDRPEVVIDELQAEARHQQYLMNG